MNELNVGLHLHLNDRLGLDGKSAYDAALEGGYTGTPSQFSQALAAIGTGGGAGGGAGGGQVVVAQAERKVGTYIDTDGTPYDLYDSAVVLTDLPQTAGATKEYQLATEPLGHGRYIRVLGLEVLSADGKTYYFDNYRVERIFVANLRTRGILRCIDPAEGCDRVILRMRYIKYLGDRLVFSVTLPAGTSPDAISMRIAPLKYNKHFAFTYTADDSVVGAYARAWRRINRKWIDDVEFFHMGVAPTTGYLPTGTLGMTDGCGNERRFPVGVALWPTWGNQYSPNGFIKDSSTSTSNPYITWEELRPILDFGGSVYYHNVDEREYGDTDPATIAKGFDADHAKAVEKLGRSMKILALPDGNAAYEEAGQLSDKVLFTRSSRSSALISLKDCTTLRKLATYGGEHTSDITRKLAELSAQRASESPYWVAITSHRVDLNMVGMLETVNNTYGKDGDDSIWVATWDEVYEYVTLREGAEAGKTVDGQTVTFEVYMPDTKGFYYRDLSLLIAGISTPDGVTVTPVSDNIKGMAHAASGSELLVNLCFNPAAVSLAEKYTAQYEASAEEPDKDDALYFASMLLPTLAAPFLSRIEKVVPGQPGGLKLNTVSISSGASTTAERNVAVTLGVGGTPTHYRISESSAFTGAAWIAYTSATVPFTLSAGNGLKTVYVQLKNSVGETAVVSDTITLEETVTPGQIVLSAVKINGGAATTSERDVTVALTATPTPTHYRMAETSSLSGVAWTAYSGAINFTLSTGNGTKTLYAQVKDANGESSVVSASISLQQAVTPTTLKSVISFGWDWSGGTSNASNYDSAMQINKVRLSTDSAVSYNMYDTGGAVRGTFLLSGFSNTGSANQGNITGSDSGIYPDKVLKFSMYKAADTPEAVATLNLPAGQYTVKLFINTKSSSLDMSAATYVLEHAGTTQTFTMPAVTVDNFTQTTDLTVTVGSGPVYIKLSTEDQRNRTLILNAIEIDEMG